MNIKLKIWEDNGLNPNNYSNSVAHAMEQYARRCKKYGLKQRIQIEIVKDIAEGMIGIGGMPTNVEFYNEFDMRLRSALELPVSDFESFLDK